MRPYVGGGLGLNKTEFEKFFPPPHAPGQGGREGGRPSGSLPAASIQVLPWMHVKSVAYFISIDRFVCSVGRNWL